MSRKDFAKFLLFSIDKNCLWEFRLFSISNGVTSWNIHCELRISEVKSTYTTLNLLMATAQHTVRHSQLSLCPCGSSDGCHNILERIILQIASLGQNEIQNSKSRSYWKRMASSVPWRWKAVVWNIVSWGPSVLMFVGEGGSRLELKRPPCTQEAHEWNPCFTWPLECVVSRARSDQGHRLHLHQEGIKIPSANRKIQSSDREIGKLPYEGGTNQDKLPCLLR